MTQPIRRAPILAVLSLLALFASAPLASAGTAHVSFNRSGTAYEGETLHGTYSYTPLVDERTMFASVAIVPPSVGTCTKAAPAFEIWKGTVSIYGANGPGTFELVPTELGAWLACFYWDESVVAIDEVLVSDNVTVDAAQISASVPYSGATSVQMAGYSRVAASMRTISAPGSVDCPATLWPVPEGWAVVATTVLSPGRPFDLQVPLPVATFALGANTVCVSFATTSNPTTPVQTDGPFRGIVTRAASPPPPPPPPPKKTCPTGTIVDADALCPPYPRTSPYISGVTRVGRRVRCNVGVWALASSVSNRWTVAGRTVARTRTLKLRARYAGKRVRCVITAVNREWMNTVNVGGFRVRR